MYRPNLSQNSNNNNNNRQPNRTEIDTVSLGLKKAPVRIVDLVGIVDRGVEIEIVPILKIDIGTDQEGMEGRLLHITPTIVPHKPNTPARTTIQGHHEEQATAEAADHPWTTLLMQRKIVIILNEVDHRGEVPTIDGPDTPTIILVGEAEADILRIVTMTATPRVVPLVEEIHHPEESILLVGPILVATAHHVPWKVMAIATAIVEVLHPWKEIGSEIEKDDVHPKEATASVGEVATITHLPIIRPTVLTETEIVTMVAAIETGIETGGVRMTEIVTENETEGGNSNVVANILSSVRLMVAIIASIPFTACYVYCTG